MSGLYKDKLTFDSADLTGSDQIGANLMASGVVLTRTTVSGKEALDVNVANSIDVSIDYTNDSVTAHQGGTWSVGLTDLIADDAADAGGSLKVGSRAIFGALSAVSNNNDRADLVADKYRRVLISDAPKIAIKPNAISVGNVTAVALPTTALAGRQEMEIQNLGSSDIFIGDSSVTVANGLRVSRNATYTLKLSDAVSIYAIASAGAANDVRVLEKA